MPSHVTEIALPLPLKLLTNVPDEFFISTVQSDRCVMVAVTLAESPEPSPSGEKIRGVMYKLVIFKRLISTVSVAMFPALSLTESLIV